MAGAHMEVRVHIAAGAHISERIVYVQASSTWLGLTWPELEWPGLK